MNWAIDEVVNSRVMVNEKVMQSHWGKNIESPHSNEF